MTWPCKFKIIFTRQWPACLQGGESLANIILGVVTAVNPVLTAVNPMAGGIVNLMTRPASNRGSAGLVQLEGLDVMPVSLYIECI